MSMTTVQLVDIEATAPAERVLDLSVVGGALSIEIRDRGGERDDDRTSKCVASMMVPLDEIVNALAFLEMSDRNACLRPDLPVAGKGWVQRVPGGIGLSPIVLASPEIEQEAASDAG